MKSRRVKLGFVLIVVLFVTCILLFLPHLLLQPLLNAYMPSGTIIVWLGLVAYAFLFYLLKPEAERKTIFSYLLLAVIILAFGWGFVSAALAGNWSFNFVNMPLRAKLFQVFTATVLFAPILIWFVYFMDKIIRHFR